MTNRAGTLVSNLSGEMAYESFRPALLPPNPPIEVSGAFHETYALFSGILSEASPQRSIFQDLLEFLYCHSSIFRCFFNRHAALSHQLNQHPHEGREEVKRRWVPFLEMLPEYKSICEDILAGNKDKYSE